jgi:hypothetical protein
MISLIEVRISIQLSNEALHYNLVASVMGGSKSRLAVPIEDKLISETVQYNVGQIFPAIIPHRYPPCYVEGRSSVIAQDYTSATSRCLF